MLIATWGHCGQISERSRKYICIHISINTYICDHLYLYPAKHEFISMSPTLIYYHKIVLASFPLLIYNFHCNSKKPASHHLPSIYSVVQFHYTCIMVSELLTHTPRGNTLLLDYCAYAELLLP